MDDLIKWTIYATVMLFVLRNTVDNSPFQLINETTEINKSSSHLDSGSFKFSSTETEKEQQGGISLWVAILISLCVVLFGVNWLNKELKKRQQKRREDLSEQKTKRRTKRRTRR